LPRVDHFRHHGRFYLAGICGIAVAVAMIGSDTGTRITYGGLVFFALYLVSTAWLAKRLTAEDLRRKASLEDEGIGLIALITLAAIGLSFISLANALGAGGNAVLLYVAIANVPLGWATLHTVMAFHYAHLFYSQAGDGSGDTGGLEFPQTEEPSISDFAYHSFVIGMTAQVSDVDATSAVMRRNILAHSIVSFFYYTVIVAFAVNVVAG
jgi:uncharacterized membrane protein